MKTIDDAGVWAVCRRVCLAVGLSAVVVGALGADLSAGRALGASSDQWMQRADTPQLRPPSCRWYPYLGYLCF
jgi:hypothetical protein